MNESDNRPNERQYPPPPEPGSATGPAGYAGQRPASGPWGNYPPQQGYPPPLGYPPQMKVKQPGRRKKWIAGFLSFFIPGIGHMYLGLMVKAIIIMMLVGLDICGLVFAGTEGNNALSIVMLAMTLAIIYFYSLFDAIQSTDAVNEYNAQSRDMPLWTNRGGGPDAFQRGGPALGLLLGAAAFVFAIVMVDINWKDRLFNSAGSMLGAVLLIGAGVVLWLWDRKGDRRGKS